MYVCMYVHVANGESSFFPTIAKFLIIYASLNVLQCTIPIYLPDIGRYSFNGWYPTLC